MRKAQATLWLLALMMVVALGRFGAGPAGAQQQGAWIYDVFVQKCREAGGTPGTSKEQFLRGETFQCRNGGASRPTPGGATACGTEAKINVDWVFQDRGARARYAERRRQGDVPFDAVVAAQAHNPRVQSLLRGCRDWVESYLAGMGEADAGRRSPTPPTRADCRCISVLPTNDLDWQGRLAYRVINSCDALEVAVSFGYDILRLSPDPNRAFTSLAQAGQVGRNEERLVRAPAGTIVTIKGYALRRAGVTVACPM